MAAGKTVSRAEREQLAELETRIETANRAAFMETGQALEKIRDVGLYRLRYKTFGAYLAGRWEVSEVHATRLMQAARVVRQMALTSGNTESPGQGENHYPIGQGKTPLPAAESHVRALMAAPPEARAGVWRDVLKLTGGHPTAKDIREAARRAQPEAPRPEPAKTAAPAPKVITGTAEHAQAAEPVAPPVKPAEKTTTMPPASFALPVAEDEHTLRRDLRIARNAADWRGRRIAELEAVIAQAGLGQPGECMAKAHEGLSPGYPASAVPPDGEKTWTGLVCGPCFERESEGVWSWSRPVGAEVIA